MAGVTDPGRERGKEPLVLQNSEVNLGVDLPRHSFGEGQKVVLLASLADSNTICNIIPFQTRAAF